MTLKRRSNESEITLARRSNDPQTTLNSETVLKRASNALKQSTKQTYTNNYLKRRSDIAQSALTRPLYTLRPSPCPAHPDSRSGYRSACLRPWALSAPNLPAIFGLLRLHLGTFSTSFSVLRIICVGACFFSLCTSVSLSLSLSLFPFHLESLLRALLSLSRASFFKVDETMRTLKLSRRHRKFELG